MNSFYVFTVSYLQLIYPLSPFIKDLASAIKNLKEIKGIKSEIDLKEQKARIKKLEKEIEANNPNGDKPYGVVLMPPIMADLTPPKEEEDE